MEIYFVSHRTAFKDEINSIPINIPTWQNKIFPKHSLIWSDVFVYTIRKTLLNSNLAVNRLHNLASLFCTQDMLDLVSISSDLETRASRYHHRWLSTFNNNSNTSHIKQHGNIRNLRTLWRVACYVCPGSS